MCTCKFKLNWHLLVKRLRKKKQSIGPCWCLTPPTSHSLSRTGDTWCPVTSRPAGSSGSRTKQSSYPEAQLDTSLSIISRSLQLRYLGSGAWVHTCSGRVLSRCRGNCNTTVSLNTSEKRAEHGRDVSWHTVLTC